MSRTSTVEELRETLLGPVDARLAELEEEERAAAATLEELIEARKYDDDAAAWAEARLAEVQRCRARFERRRRFVTNFQTLGSAR